jgi:hypothetical protein
MWERIGGGRSVEKRGAMANCVDVGWSGAESWQTVGQAIPSLRGGSETSGEKKHHNTATQTWNWKRNTQEREVSDLKSVTKFRTRNPPSSQ